METPPSFKFILPIISSSVIHLTFNSDPFVYPVSLAVAISEAIESVVVAILNTYFPDSKVKLPFICSKKPPTVSNIGAEVSIVPQV